MTKKIKMTTSWGIASLVLGIIGLLLFLAPYIGLFLSILAIVFYGVQKKYHSTGMALGGLVTGIIGVVINAILLIFVVGLFSFLALGTTDNIEANSEIKSPSLREGVSKGDFLWKIKDVSTTNKIGQDLFGTFLGVETTGIFIILDVEVTNVAKSSKFLSGSSIVLIDKKGRSFSPNTEASIYLETSGYGSALLFEEVSPGITKRGSLAYEVPLDFEIAEIKVLGSLEDSLNVISKFT